MRVRARARACVCVCVCVCLSLGEIYIHISVRLEREIETYADSTMNGPCLGISGYRHGPWVQERVRYLQCFVSELVLAIFEGTSPNLDSAKSSVFEKCSPLKCRSHIWQFVIQKWDLIFFEKSCPKNAQ